MQVLCTISNIKFRQLYSGTWNSVQNVLEYVNALIVNWRKLKCLTTLM